MKYCTHCGKQMLDDAVICTNCGCPINDAKGIGTANSTADVPSIGLNFLGFFVPIVGLILYCTMHSHTPRKAGQIGLFALIGFIMNFILVLVMFNM